MNNPLVTIGIPVYNVEKFIVKSLRSVLCQDYNNIEILIVYDKSDDNSLHLAKSTLKNSGFSVSIILNEKENKGLGNARNVILDNYSGDYLFFLDSDDYLESLSISQFVEEAIINDADVVVGSHRSVDDSNKVLEQFQFSKKEIFNNQLLKNYIYVENKFYPVYAWNKLYKRSFLSDNKLRYIHNDVEDALFSFQLIEKVKKILFLPNISLNYLIRKDSLTRASFKFNRAKIFISIRDFIYDFHKNNTNIYSNCCKVDTFFMTYVMIFRDAYKSDLINKNKKDLLYKSALRTPKINLRFFIGILLSKRYKIILMLIVKVLPYKLNLFLIKLYHYTKRIY